jgi:hypothetical protein
MSKQPNISLKAPSGRVSQLEMNPSDLTIPGRELLAEVEAALIAQGIKHRHSPQHEFGIELPHSG